MAMSRLGRVLISKTTSTSLLSRSFSSSSPLSASSALLRLRPLFALSGWFPAAGGARCFSTRPTTSSLNDPSPNWSNRPPKETILLDGCDFEHWLVVMEPPPENTTRDEIIDSYIKTLATVVGSEDEARTKIYSVSTRHYFAFGCLVPEELSYKIKELPKVRWVLPDSYLDVKNKDYGGEPFIDGQAVPYDTKYHEEWVRNNARANERSRRNDRPRDRSRNFERRRENMQNRDFQSNMPPMPNRDAPGSVVPPSSVAPPRDGPGVVGGMPNRDAGHGGEFMNRDVSNPGVGGMPNRDYQNQQIPPNRDMGGVPNSGYQNQGMPINREIGGPPNRDYQNQGMGGAPNRDYQNQGAPINRGMGGGPAPGYQNQGMPFNMDMGGAPAPGYQSQGMPFNRDMGGVPAPGYQNQGVPPVPTPGFQNQGVPPGPAPGYQNQGVPPGPNRTYQNQGNYQGQGSYQTPPSNYPSHGPPMPNRDFQSSYTPNRDTGGVGGGNTYQGRDMPPLPNRDT